MQRATQTEEKPAPYVVKVGTVSVRISTQSDGRQAIYYQLTKGGKRKKITRGTFVEAKAAATKLCHDIANGRRLAGTLTDEQRLQLLSAQEYLQPLGLSVDLVARDVAEAAQLTGSTNIGEMARFWARHHQAASSQRTAGEILAEMIQVKAKQGLDAEYLRNVREPLEKFALAVTGPIGHITAKDIRRYLDERMLKPRTSNNLRASLVMLFRYARGEGDLADGMTTEPEKLGKAKESKKPPRVYTAHQLRGWLDRVRPEWLPWMAIGAFAGIRTEEVERMDWSDIQWITKEIYIRPEVAKTGEGRYVPLLDNLLAWLSKYRKGTGPIFPPKGRPNLETGRMNRLLREEAKTTGEKPLVWDRNALRHSYGSHRLGIIQDLAKLTVEMGNSIAVNRRNYQNPRSRQQCVEYFNLYPSGMGNVVPMTG